MERDKTLSIDGNFSDVNFNVKFEDRINVIFDSSGTGKTFLMKVINEQCHAEEIKCQYFDYHLKDAKEEAFISLATECEVLLLDNADLYLSKSLYKKLFSMEKKMIISIKRLSNIDTRNVGIYYIEYNGDNLEVVREG